MAVAHRKHDYYKFAMKFKNIRVGDRVRIRPESWYDETTKSGPPACSICPIDPHYDVFAEEMKVFCGCEAVVTELIPETGSRHRNVIKLREIGDKNQYREIQMSDYNFHDWMLEDGPELKL